METEDTLTGVVAALIASGMDLGQAAFLEDATPPESFFPHS
jgi:NAD(P)H-hydrate repair Nnr-like enzyme with NAD(P)H-hydrate dehydratase domain